MKAIVQRVSQANVIVGQDIVGQINQGLLVLLGVEKSDQQQNVEQLVNKIINMRIFSDSKGKMNLSLLDIQGSLLVVSQFTLIADTKGRRPSFSKGAEPEMANYLYQHFLEFANKYVITESGVFAADMQVSLINDGPVTFILES